MAPEPVRLVQSALRPAMALALALLLGACASVPPPTQVMTRAQNQLQAAHAAQAADYAPVDMDFAKSRYQEAQAAMAAKKYALATDLANEAQADGQLAQTRAQLAVLRKQIQAKTADNVRLRAQLLSQPSSSASTPAPAASDNSGLPAQVVLPEPAAPAPAASSSRPVPPAQQQPVPAGGHL